MRRAAVPEEQLDPRGRHSLHCRWWVPRPAAGSWNPPSTGSAAPDSVAPTAFADRIPAVTGRLSQRSRTVPMPHPADPSSSAALREPRRGRRAAGRRRGRPRPARRRLGGHAARTAARPGRTSLQTAVRILLTSRFSMWMAWGPELTFFCNDAYRRDTLGKKYPWALGRPAREVWSEIWHDIGPRIDARDDAPARPPGTSRCCCSSSAAATPRRPTTRSPTARSSTTTARSPGCSAWSRRTPRRSSPRRRMADAARPRLATRRRSAPRTRRSPPRPRRLAGRPARRCRSRWSTCSTRTATTARLAGRDRRSTATTPRRPSLDAADPDAAWPVAALAAGETVLRRRTSTASAPLPTGAWDEPPLQALVVPLPQQGQRAPYGFLVAGAEPATAPLDDGYRRLLRPGRRAARGRHHRRPRLRVRAPPGREPRRARPGQDRLLHQRQPRVPHPADAAARPGRGRARRRRGAAARRPARARRGRSCATAAAAQAGQQPARLLPARVRTRRGRASSRSTSPRYTRELASMFDGRRRAAGPDASTSTARRCPSRCYVDRGPVGEGRAQPALERAEVHLRGRRSRSALDATADGAPCSTVADTGTGIPAAEQAHLFERFHRVSGARSRTHEGSGIGLALVAELAEPARRRRSRSSSAPGEGSTFTVAAAVRHARTCPPTRSPRPRRRPTVAVAAARRGLPRRGDALAATGRRAPTARAGRRGADATRAADPGRRRQRRHARVRRRRCSPSDYAVQTAVRRRRRRSRRRARAAAGPGAHRRDDARLDGFGLLAALRADPRHGRRPGRDALGAGRRGGHPRGPRRRRRRLPRQAVHRPRAAGAGPRQPRARPGAAYPRRSSSAAGPARPGRSGSPRSAAGRSTSRPSRVRGLRRVPAAHRARTADELAARSASRAVDGRSSTPTTASASRRASTAAVGAAAVRLRVPGRPRPTARRRAGLVHGEVVTRRATGAPTVLRGSRAGHHRAARRRGGAGAGRRQRRGGRARARDRRRAAAQPAAADGVRPRAPRGRDLLPRRRRGHPGRRRLVRRHRARRRPHRARRRRRDGPRRPGRGGDGPAPRRGARLRPARPAARPTCWSRSTASSATSARTRSSPASTPSSTRPTSALRFANAGHLPPIVAVPGGECRLGSAATRTRRSASARSTSPSTRSTCRRRPRRALHRRAGRAARRGPRRRHRGRSPRRVAAADRARSTALPEELVAAMLPDGPDDDVAILVARVDPPAGEDEPSRRSRSRAEARSVAEARHLVAAYLRRAGRRPRGRHDAALVTSELVTNAVAARPAADRAAAAARGRRRAHRGPTTGPRYQPRKLRPTTTTSTAAACRSSRRSPGAGAPGRPRTARPSGAPSRSGPGRRAARAELPRAGHSPVTRTAAPSSAPGAQVVERVVGPRRADTS